MPLALAKIEALLTRLTNQRTIGYQSQLPLIIPYNGTDRMIHDYYSKVVACEGMDIPCKPEEYHNWWLPSINGTVWCKREIAVVSQHTEYTVNGLLLLLLLLHSIRLPFPVMFKNLGLPPPNVPNETSKNEWNKVFLSATGRSFFLELNH